MKSTVLAAALLCAMTNHVNAEGNVHPGLHRVMADGAGQVAGYTNRGARWTLTCEDIRAIVRQIGETRAIEAAQAYGAGESQIEIARQCLTKKTKK